MIVDVVRSAAYIHICRVRQLPLPGQVLVNVNQTVAPEDVIAEAKIPDQVMILDLVRGLGLSPDEANECAVREVGTFVRQGDVIAQFQGAFTRLVRTPIDAQIIDIDQGKAVLAASADQVRVFAGMVGTVESLIPEFGAVIVNRGALLQGVWGNGRVGSGPISLVGETSAVALLEEDVEGLPEGALLAAGVCLHASVLEAVQECGINGLVVGGLAPELKPLALKMTLPVIVLNGFGLLPIDPVSYRLLEAKNGSLASLNASAPNLLNGARPEIIIPHEDEGPVEPVMGFQVKLSLGQQVRVLSGAAQGQVGEVVELPSARFRFESGLKIHAARVRLHGGQYVSIPRQNLEVMG
jgi:hypothetical protein